MYANATNGGAIKHHAVAACQIVVHKNRVVPQKLACTIAKMCVTDSGKCGAPNSFSPARKNGMSNAICRGYTK